MYYYVFTCKASLLYYIYSFINFIFIWVIYMDHELIIMSEKGLIQIPKSIRNMLFAHAFTIKVQDADIILTPVAEVEGALSSFATQDLKKTE